MAKHAKETQPIKMSVIPDPPKNTRPILAPTFTGPAIKSYGDLNYSCGYCATVLLKNVSYKQVQNMVVKCGECSSFNEVPTSYQAH